MLAAAEGAVTVTVPDGGGRSPPPPPPPRKPAGLTVSSTAGGPKESFQLTVGVNQPAVVEKGQIGYTLWAHNLAYASSFLNVLFGLVAYLWQDTIAQRPQAGEFLFALPYVGVYAMVLGVLVYAFEYFFGLQQVWWLWMESAPNNVRSPLRALMYWILATPCFLSYPTMLGGLTLMMCSMVNLKAFLKKECIDSDNVPYGSYLLCKPKVCCGDKKVSQGADSSSSSTNPRLTFREWVHLKWKRQEELGNIGQIILIVIYTTINLVLFFFRFGQFQSIVAESQKKCIQGVNEFNCLSSYAPWAKGFGFVLNFNCAIIVLPVLRTFIAALHNAQIKHSGKTCVQKMTPPLRKNLVFHKVIGLVILVSGVGHGFFHFMNWMDAPEFRARAFPAASYVSGFLISLCMVIILTGAQNRIKRARFEIFWYSHNTFLLVFPLLLTHGPYFWIFCLLPVIAYALERYNREKLASNTFYLHKVVYKKPVMAVTFFPDSPNFTFKEGQYLMLRIPSISWHEFHPFTISSASEEMDKTGVSLHIRVQKPGSWTDQARRYFEAMARPENKKDGNFLLELEHLDGKFEKRAGKHIGPDGLPLIQIEGPHAAPAQHYSEFQEIMLIGAGIGLTPSASIIQSVLKHKWRLGFNPGTIHFFFCVRQSEVASFRWFVKLLHRLQEQVYNEYENGTTSRETNRLWIHIFVTGVKDQTTPLQREPSFQSRQALEEGMDRAKTPGRTKQLKFTAEELESRILCPEVKSKDFAKLVRQDLDKPNGEVANQLFRTFIWNGRPPWNDIFTVIKGLPRETNSDAARIGVVFCGTPIIGKDLKTMCERHSSLQDKVLFNLHKENF